jgi:HD-GYP domain-containing protein (c-di-GMP phosphodiesterase class II)
MTINYKKELERAAKNMILVHDPQLLIKMIVRMLIQKVEVSHAGILLYDSDVDSYVLTVSRGSPGVKIPSGFVRVDYDNPLIRIFYDEKYRRLLSNGAAIYQRLKRTHIVRGQSATRRFVGNVLYQMELFGSVVAIPSFFGHTLHGMLLLGPKKNNKKFGADEIDFFVALASDVAIALRNAQLFRDLSRELEQKRRLFINTTVALAAAIDAKDYYTHGHTARVTALSVELAQMIRTMNHGTHIDDQFIEHLQMASSLHDIGKIGIPENILNKDGPLTHDERAIMQDHPLKGVAILQPIKELEQPISGVKHHHERFDGTGYPDGLRGSQIPLIAAVIAVADTFDAMTTDRPYRHGLSKAEAVAEIRKLSGTQFDPLVVEACIKLYEEGKL